MPAYSPGQHLPAPRNPENGEIFNTDLGILIKHQELNKK